MVCKTRCLLIRPSLALFRLLLELLLVGRDPLVRPSGCTRARFDREGMARCHGPRERIRSVCRIVGSAFSKRPSDSLSPPCSSSPSRADCANEINLSQNSAANRKTSAFVRSLHFKRAYTTKGPLVRRGIVRYTSSAEPRPAYRWRLLAQTPATGRSISLPRLLNVIHEQFVYSPQFTCRSFPARTVGCCRFCGGTLGEDCRLVSLPPGEP